MPLVFNPDQLSFPMLVIMLSFFNYDNWKTGWDQIQWVPDSTQVSIICFAIWNASTVEIVQIGLK